MSITDEAIRNMHNTIDRALDRGPLDERVPTGIEAAAIVLYEREAEAMTGKRWDWKASSEEVRNRFRLRVCLSQLGYRGFD